MALTVDKLMNDDRFSGDNVLQFLLYLPFGIILMLVRIIMALLLWIASILLPNKWAIRQMLSTFACWTFGVYVKVKGTRDPRCSVLVANYVSCLDSLAASHVLGTISLRKWKVPPFFASTLGIRNAAQFARNGVYFRQHFAECPSMPVLLQPEGGPTNGRGLLKFTDWPFQMGNRVQPVAISVSRPFSHVTVHRWGDHRGAFPWSDALWFLWTPVTLFEVLALPALERHDDSDRLFAHRIRTTIAEALGVEMTEFTWEQVNRCRSPRRAPPAPPAPAPRAAVTRLAAQVKEVLPAVPLEDIVRDLATTGSVDVTITNFLEGATSYTPEPEPQPQSRPQPQPQPGPSHLSTAPRYVTPAPTGVFSKTAKERQLSFQERKAQMIAEARQRYIEKHNLDIPAC